MDEGRFRSHVARIFGGVEPGAIDFLWKLTLEAIEQKHGTMLVILEDAAKEAERLQGQSTRIKPVKLDAEVLRYVTSIDGAVLVDPQGVCHAIGVILDGVATKKGSSSRGARYNSAIRYQAQKPSCLAIVISEDGSIDLIPDLKPQILRSIITDAVNQLRALRDAPTVERKAYISTMHVLQSASFYLLPEVCSEINEINKVIAKRLEAEWTRGFRPIYPDFVPNDEMNDGYFLKPEQE